MIAECLCRFWPRTEEERKPFTSPHPRCVYADVAGDARQIIESLLHTVEELAREQALALTDEQYGAYVAGKTALGESIYTEGSL